MSKGTWVQTERKAHEAWDLLIRKNASAARLMHRLVALMDKRGAVVISQKTLAEMLDVHRNTVGKAIKVLEKENWLEVVLVGGEKGGVKGYRVNRRIAWADKRENQRYAAFDARVIVSASEQTDNYFDKKPDLMQLPQSGEGQIPSGLGLDPPSQQLLEGSEPDLPATGGDSHLQNSLDLPTEN